MRDLYLKYFYFLCSEIIIIFFPEEKKLICINKKLHTKWYVIVPALCRFTSCFHIIADVISSLFQVSLREAMTSQNRLS